MKSQHVLHMMVTKDNIKRTQKEVVGSEERQESEWQVDKHCTIKRRVRLEAT